MSTREERKARKAARMKRDMENKGGGSGNYAVSKNGNEFEFFKSREREGTDLKLDIIPYIINSDKHPEVIKGNLEVGDEDYMLEYWRHNNLGPDQKWNAVCLKETFGKPCPICEMIASEIANGADEDDLPKPKRRVLYNVRDLEKSPNDIKVFDVSYYLFHRELKDKLDRWPGGWFDFSDLDEGKTVKFYCFHNSLGRGFTDYKEFDFVDRSPVPEAIMDKAIALETLLTVRTYGELEMMLAGESPESVEEDYVPHREAQTSPDATSSTPTEKPESREEPAVEEPAAEEKQTADPGTEKKLAFNGRCPYGIRFGVDIDNPIQKKVCGVECDDETWSKCRECADKNKSEQSRLLGN